MTNRLLLALSYLLPIKEYRHKLRKYIKQKITKDKFLYSEGLTNKSLKIDYSGNNNKVIIYGANGKKIINPKKVFGINILFVGDNNLVEIYMPCIFYNTTVLCIDGSTVSFNQISSKKCLFEVDHASSINIDENSCVGHSAFHVLGETNNHLSIGKNCMFAANQEFWAGDGHTIFNNQRDILNYSPGITIGNHVWVGNRCTILGGVNIPDHCIIGAGSLVNKTFTESSIIIAGNPAKKIKENINWDKESIALFK